MTPNNQMTLEEAYKLLDDFVNYPTQNEALYSYFDAERLIEATQIIQQVNDAAKFIEIVNHQASKPHSEAHWRREMADDIQKEARQAILNPEAPSI